MSDPIVVDVSDLAPGQLRRIDAGERRLLVCNAEGTFYALEDRCPHAAVPLSGGVLRGCLLECPLHGGSVDVRDGSPAALPIRRPATTYPVRTLDGGSEIEIAIESESDAGIEIGIEPGV